MRGSLMTRLTKEQHIAVLTACPDNGHAAERYSAMPAFAGKTVNRNNVFYWREVFITSGTMAGADRMLKAKRKFVTTSPYDDFGLDQDIPEVAHRLLVIPDIHAPYQHPDTLAFLSAVKQAVNPDCVVNLGDELDFHALSFHDADPDLDSAGTELEKAKVFMHNLHELFPDVLVCHSNHGSMTYRKAKAHGIPVAMIKKYRDVIFPDTSAPGWSWAEGWRIQTPLGVVMFKHQAAGILGEAAHNQCSLVVGHNHGNFSIEYAASSAHLYFGMYSGCLIDKDALAFAYGKHTRNKPVIGCSAIIEGRPTLIPMVLNTDGRWIGQL